MSDASPLIILAVIFGVGAVIAIGFMAWDLARLREEEIRGEIKADWQPVVARALGSPFVRVFSGDVSFEVDGVIVEVRSPCEGEFQVSGTCSSRDLTAKAEHSGALLATGAGWDALDGSRRQEVEDFVRDGGSIASGRTMIGASGVEATATVARRVASLTKTLAGFQKQDMASILRRVTSADDPGRVSFAEIPEAAGKLSAPVAAGALSAKNPIETVTRMWAATGAGEDRVLAIPHEGRMVLVIADGAGGTGGGAAAAERILARTQHVAAALCSGAYAPAALLAELDRTLAPTGGEAAAVVAVVSPTGIHGACVGDVEAILLVKGAAIDLTAERRRKPLLGCGNVVPIPFSAEGAGRVLVATDGLFKYASHERLVEMLHAGSLQDVPDRLIELVRLRSGDLQDDVGLVLCDLAGSGS